MTGQFPSSPPSSHTSGGCTRRICSASPGRGLSGAPRHAAPRPGRPAARPERPPGDRPRAAAFPGRLPHRPARRPGAAARAAGTAGAARPGQQDVRLHAALPDGDPRPRDGPFPALVQPRPGGLARGVRGRPNLGEPAGRLGPASGLRVEPRRRRRPAGDPERRYKLANWQATRAREDRPGDDGGMYVGFSPDGFRWTAYAKNPVLPTWPDGYGKPSRHGVGDIVDVYYDPLEQALRRGREGACDRRRTASAGPSGGEGIRRLVGLSTSPDFLHWERPGGSSCPTSGTRGCSSSTAWAPCTCADRCGSAWCASSATTCPATPAARRTASATRCSRPAATA